MNDTRLRDLLDGLHDELHHVESLDEKGRALLRDLDGDIRDLLERSGDEGIYSNESVLGRLQSGMDHFEITHPKLVTLLSEMLNALSNAGI
jgi:hypothetical protein